MPESRCSSGLRFMYIAPQRDSTMTMARPVITAEMKKSTGRNGLYQRDASLWGTRVKSVPSEDWCRVEKDDAGHDEERRRPGSRRKNPFRTSTSKARSTPPMTTTQIRDWVRAMAKSTSRPQAAHEA